MTTQEVLNHLSKKYRIKKGTIYSIISKYYAKQKIAKPVSRYRRKRGASPDEKNAILDAYAKMRTSKEYEGVSQSRILQELAAQCDWSANTIYRWLKESQQLSDV